MQLTKLRMKLGVKFAPTQKLAMDKKPVNYGSFNLASIGARFQRNHAGCKANHLDKNCSKLCFSREK